MADSIFVVRYRCYAFIRPVLLGGFVGTIRGVGRRPRAGKGETAIVPAKLSRGSQERECKRACRYVQSTHVPDWTRANSC